MPTDNQNNGNRFTGQMTGQDSGLTQAAIVSALKTALGESLSPIQSMSANMRELTKAFERFDTYTRQQNRKAERESSSGRYSGGLALRSDIKSITELGKSLEDFNKALKENRKRLNEEMSDIWDDVSAHISRNSPLSDIMKKFAEKTEKANNDFLAMSERIANSYQAKYQELTSTFTENMQMAEAVHAEAIRKQAEQEEKIARIRDAIQQKEKEIEEAQESLGGNTSELAKRMGQLVPELSALENDLKVAEEELAPLSDSAKSATDSLESLASGSEEAKRKLQEEYSLREQAAEKQLEQVKKSIQEQRETVRKGYEDIRDVFGTVSGINPRAKELLDKMTGENLSEGTKNAIAMQNAIKSLEINGLKYQERLAELQAQYDEARGTASQEVIDQLQEQIISQKELIDENKKATTELIKSQSVLRQSGAILKDSLKSFSKSFLDNAQKLANNFITRHMKYYENYYRENLEGFKTMYASIEKTMSDVANRLKLDQGGFDDLEKAIDQSLEAQNLQGSLSVADVNELVVSLANAGITNTEEVAALAVQQARLSASGSTFDLTNEGILRELRLQAKEAVQSGEFESFEDALRSITDNIAGTEMAFKDAGMDITSFASGSAAQVYETVAKLTTDAGGSIEDFNKNLRQALSASQQLEDIGIDSSLILTELSNIVNGKVTDQSTINKVAYTTGLSSDEIQSLAQTGDLGTAMQRYTDIMRSRIQSIPDRYLSIVADEYGMSGTTSELRRIRNYGSSLSLTDEMSDAVARGIEEANQNIASGAYRTATEQRQIETQNEYFDEALEYQQQYRGDEKYLATQESIYDAVTDILYTLKDLALNFVLSGASIAGKGIIGRMRAGKATSGGGTSSVGSSGSDVYTGYNQGSDWTSAGYISNAPTDNLYYSGKHGLTIEKGSYGSATGSFAGDFATGARGTTAGNLGRIAGAGVGVFEIGSSVYENIQRDAEGNVNLFQTGVETLQDEDTWRGIGMTVGSAVGGPVAGAVIGELMSGGAKLGNWLSDTFDTRSYDEMVFDTAVEAFSKSAEQMESAAQQQLDAAQQQLENIQEMDDAQMRHDLITQYNLSPSEVNNMTREELKEAYEAQITPEIEAAKKGLTTAQYVGSITQTKAKLKTSGIIGSGSVDLTKDVSTGYSQGLLDIMTETESVGDKDFIFNLYDYVETQRKLNPEKSREDIIKETLGDTMEDVDQGTMHYVHFLNEIDEHKKEYERSNEIFHERWEEAKQLAKSDSPWDILTAYQTKLHYPNAHNLPDTVVTEHWDDETNLPNLNDGNGRYFPEYYKGMFATGLTDVPYNGYPAILHTGERVLTREEAKAYNKLSSNSISNLADIMNDDSITNAITSSVDNIVRESSYIQNVNNSTTSGYDDSTAKSIDDHTQSIENLLNGILNAINSLASSLGLRNFTSGMSNENVRKMDSNVFRAIGNSTFV